VDLKGRLTRREMLKLSGGALAGASLLGVAGCGSGGGSGSASKSLTLGSIGWTENIAVSNLTKVALGDEMGYDVTLKGPLDLGPMFQGLASGDLDAFQDVWLPNHEQYLSKPQIKPRVEVLDPWYQGTTKYGITVLSYMKGITSIADLPDAGTDEITGIDPGAAFMPVIEDTVIPEYNLNEAGIHLVTSSEAGMLAEVQKKNAAKEPIVFTGWSPHWMNLKYDIVYLDDPKNAQGAFDNPSKITCAVNKDLESNDPAAYAYLKNISLTEDQINEIEDEMSKAGTGNEEQGVKNWYDQNKDVVQPWIEAAKNA
jgi:glycine betaine/proline transport system substrate-binding protein